MKFNDMKFTTKIVCSTRYPHWLECLSCNAKSRGVSSNHKLTVPEDVVIISIMPYMATGDKIVGYHLNTRTISKMKILNPVVSHLLEIKSEGLPRTLPYNWVLTITELTMLVICCHQ